MPLSSTARYGVGGVKDTGVKDIVRGSFWFIWFVWLVWFVWTGVETAAQPNSATSTTAVQKELIAES